MRCIEGVVVVQTLEHYCVLAASRTMYQCINQSTNRAGQDGAGRGPIKFWGEGVVESFFCNIDFIFVVLLRYYY